MARRSIDLDFIPDRHARPGPFRRAVFVLLCLVVTPIAYEVSLISAARWNSLYGPYTHAETPLLDAGARLLGEGRRFLANFVHDRLHDLPWHTTVVMVVGALAFGFGYWILRRA
jgi:hypothetical protein